MDRERKIDTDRAWIKQKRLVCLVKSWSQGELCVHMRVCMQSAGIFPRTGTPHQVKRDPGWHRSITNADGCPFATRLIFIYLFVYLRLVYLLMELKDVTANFNLLKKKMNSVQHLHLNGQPRLKPCSTFSFRFQPTKYLFLSGNGKVIWPI